MGSPPRSLRYFPNASDGVRLGPFLSLDNVEFDFIPFFQALITVELNRAVMHKYVRTVVSADEAITLRVVEPLDLAFILSH
jgi:hypothetical protein